LPEVERRLEALRQMHRLAGTVDYDATVTAPQTAITDAPAPGKVVPGYEILGELGRGGMGVVYKARQTKLGRIVALKMILSGAHAGTAEHERFRTEAEAIARLQHPNIVQIHEISEQDGLPYFSLEFCAGGSLAHKLAGTPLPPRDSAALVEQLARAMQAAHDAGVIHRDLKPANVLLSPLAFGAEGSGVKGLGTPKITDFGLAKKLDEAGRTATGAVMGTPSYLAPEQAGGKSKEIGPRCDIYALGAILYECLTGRAPFKAATSLDTIMQVISEEPVRVRLLNSRVPRDLATICHKCLQKVPADRYRTAGELADDLGRFLRGEPTRARPIGALGRAWRWGKRHPLATGLMALACMLLVIGIGIGIAMPRITYSATPPRGPVVSLNATPVTVEEWKEAEEVLSTAGHNAIVFKYSGGDVTFWLELHRGGHTLRYPDQPMPLIPLTEKGVNPVPAGLELKELKDAPEAIEGYFIWTRGNSNEWGQEPWSIAQRRSRVVRAGASTAVNSPFAEAKVSRSQAANAGGAMSFSSPLHIWNKKPIDLNAFHGAQTVVWLTQADPTSRIVCPAIGGNPRQATYILGANTWEVSSSAIANPQPANQDVCLREMRREKKQMGVVIEQHIIRIMCRVVSEKASALEAKNPGE
jgi:hypothetical protein